MNNRVNQLKSILKSRLFSNFSWLFVLNLANTIIPYFTFPYITRVFLPSGYGQLSFALAFIGYFLAVIDYGFNLTGARQVALSDHDNNQISRIFSSIFAVKFILFLLTVPIIILFTTYNSQLREVRNLVYIFIFLAFSHVLIPTWLFQGLQKVKYLTIISIIMRSGFLFCVFAFVKTQNDIILYSIIYSVSFVAIGLTSLAVSKVALKIRFVKISFYEVKNMVVEGFYVFTSSAVVKVMSTTGILVLGLFSSAEITGYFSSMSKISQLITTMFYPVGQALYPYHCQKFNTSFDLGFASVKKVFKYIVPFFAIIAVIIIVFRKLIVSVFLGNEYMSASNLLVVIAFLPLISIVSNLIGTQVLLANGHTKEYSRAFIRGSIISIVAFFVLGYFFNMWGVAIAALFGATLKLILLYFEVNIIVREKGKKSFPSKE